MRTGWIILCLVLLLAACGPPEVTDLDSEAATNGGQTGGGGNGGGGGGDDDDDGGSTTGTPTPGAIPTITNVPSFATWDATVRANGCNQCHSGGSGGLTMVPGDTNASNKKYYWFSALCNRDEGGGEGTQDYMPATGRFKRIYCGEQGHAGGAVSQAACDAVLNWFAEGTATPPDCNANYDLMNSQ